MFSICIPAYKNVQYLKRLLDSIVTQTYTNYEVVVTDDSPDDEVERLCKDYQNRLNLHYHKNQKNLNTPENWNEAIRKASGEWIKLIHDDDWFSNENSLKIFADAANANPDTDFLFSAYTNVYEGTEKKQTMFIQSFWKKALLKNPNILIADNVIGPPSVILHRNNKEVWYDRSMKYIVDIDFYIRYLEKSKPFYISESLIKVGINKDQVTKYTFGVVEVHLKEALLLLSKTGSINLNNIIVFDGWWRLIRNFQITNIKQIREAGYDGELPFVIKKMIAFQKKIPFKMLQNGITSKALMASCYIFLKTKKAIS